ncbi:MAG: TIGR02996 domain-containing protein, partial [Gemmataceae bacterium]
MTAQAEAFFHALQQNPDDDLTRLVYADFLEESGSPPDAARAELIRVQVALAASPGRRAGPLADRQDELLARWGCVWLGPWADALDGWTFRRGFVEAVTADATSFLECAPQWFAAWPTLAAAKLTRANGLVGELADSPWLAHLRGLDLSDNGLD